MVRHRPDCDTGTFYLPLDLRQMHAPDAYFGNAQCVQTVRGEPVKLYLFPQSSADFVRILQSEISFALQGSACLAAAVSLHA